jgi:hypothetical protein
MKRFLLLLIPLISLADTVKDREGSVRADKESMAENDRWIYNDVDAAFAKAKTEKKPVLVVLRCVPCLACVGIDGEITNSPELTPLLDQFVCLRLIDTNSLDLSRFQFDYDLSLSALILNADGTTYGRFGSWKHQKDPAEKSIKGFKASLTAALSLHKFYPKNKASLKGKQPRPLSYKTPLEIPQIAKHQRNFKPDLDWQGKVVPSCVHCHQIGDGLKAVYRDQKKPLPLRLSHPMPEPETVGIVFHDSKPTTIAKILPDSPAAKARLQPGDEILLVDGDTPISTADFSWTLHHLRDQDQLPLLITRKDILRPATLILPNNWRLKSDISRRVGTWPMRAWIGGGMKLESLSDKDRNRLKLKKDQLALRAVHVGQYNNHAAAKRAGFLKGDILIEVDGLKKNLSESQLFGTLLKRHPKPTKLDCQIIRKGKTINLKFPIQ